MDKNIKNVVIGGLLVFVTSIVTTWIDKRETVRFWAQQEAFQYQKFLFEKRLQLFERYQKIISSPLSRQILVKDFMCSDKECNDYVVEFKTTIALIKEFFPNTPTQLIESGLKYTDNGGIGVERKLLFEISNAMSKEFSYKLQGFGYRGDSS